MKKEVNIGLIGFGVVGSGTMQLLREHKKDIERRVGAKVKVLWVCSRRKKNSRLIPKGAKQTKDWKKVISDPKVDCVVELIGGTNPASQIVRGALKGGKHVVTANKALLSNRWNDVIGLARKQRKLIYFEASVGGGVPIVQALNEGLAGDKVRKIMGILNGTTNFILTRMQKAGLTFSEALKEAQVAGFAEANPTFDVKGVDAAQKLSILASLAVGRWVPPQKVYCEGIDTLQLTDLKLVKKHLDSNIKLLGIAEKMKKGWLFRVHPTVIHETHPFINVRNEYNAVSLVGNASEDVMLYGKGAGRLPTASAVVSDLIFLCRQIANGTAGRLPYVSVQSNGPLKLANISDVWGRYYLRVTSTDSSGVLSKITGILGRKKVSIDAIHQDPEDEDLVSRGVPTIFVTNECLESNVQSAVKAINGLSSTLSKSVLLRMQ